MCITFFWGGIDHRFLGHLGRRCPWDSQFWRSPDLKNWEYCRVLGTGSRQGPLPNLAAWAFPRTQRIAGRSLLPSVRLRSSLDPCTLLAWQRERGKLAGVSHHRSVALALERLSDPRAVGPLAALLKKPGMQGHVMTDLEPLPNADVAKRRRTGPLREIFLARVLYRRGDYHGLGEQILRGYVNDIRGLFSPHAQAVLDEDRTP